MNFRNCTQAALLTFTGLLVSTTYAAIPKHVLYENVGAPTYVFQPYRTPSQYFPEPNDACEALVQNSGSSGVGYRYDNPRFGEKPGYGWGCFYDLKYMRFETGEIIYSYPDTFYQNWVIAHAMCPGESAFLQNGACFVRRPLWEDSCPIGNPVYVGSGVKRQVEMDYSSVSSGFALSRVYSSKNSNKKSGIFGKGWFASEFEGFLSFAQDYYGSGTNFIFVNFPERSPHLFQEIGNSWTAVNDYSYSLVFSENEYVYKNLSSGKAYYFSADGVLEKITKINGKEYSLEYSDENTPINIAASPDLLIGISDNSGLRIDLHYNGSSLVQSSFVDNQLLFNYEYADGRLVKRVDNAGNERAYQYEEQNSPNPLNMLIGEDGYTSNSKYIVSGVYPGDIFQGGDVSSYIQNFDNFTGNFERHPLTGVIDNGIRVSTYMYDDFGRVVSSSDGYGSHSFEYDIDKTVVTNKLGKVTQYNFATLNNRRRIVSVEGFPSGNCAASNRSYTYNNDGFTTSETDWEGNITTYTRDSLGRELTRTEAADTPNARTIATEWHATLNVPVKVTTPESITNYSYDSAGQLISKHVAPIGSE